MGESDIRRIMEGLSAIDLRISSMGERIAAVEATVKALDTKVDKYNGLKDKVAALEGNKDLCVAAISEIKNNCKTVQDNKAKTRIPWQNIVPSVITGVIMILAGAIFALILKG